jgi:hypothetical protein
MILQPCIWSFSHIQSGRQGAVYFHKKACRAQAFLRGVKGSFLRTAAPAGPGKFVSLVEELCRFLGMIGEDQVGSSPLE